MISITNVFSITNTFVISIWNANVIFRDKNSLKLAIKSKWIKFQDNLFLEASEASLTREQCNFYCKCNFYTNTNVISITNTNVISITNTNVIFVFRDKNSLKSAIESKWITF